MSNTISLRAIAKRRFSSDVTSTLDAWIAEPKSLTLTDTLTPTHLADLYVTLPTRDGSRLGRPYRPPTQGTPIAYGHHLAFFHPRHPERALRPDGTDADFCPPDPFTRRMWASGSMRWHARADGALRVGDAARAVCTVDSDGIEKKGFGGVGGGGQPMVFVRQRIVVTAEGRSEPAVVEERSHVYLASCGHRREPRRVTGLPKPDFAFTYRPSLTTLFRFSALTFNGHHIHLDKDYAQRSEGYPERLVHGPLTALMLLEVLQFCKPGLQFHAFEYRARNPIIVNRNSTIYGALTGETKADMWCADDDGVVGMTGSVIFSGHQ